MFKTIEWTRSKYSKLIAFIEKHGKIIPFSRYMLLYLKIPFFARILLTAIMFILANGISYIIGFIILQSKAKNEVLSLITAFQNPIDFSDRLVHYYAFVYFCVLIPTLILFGAYLFGGMVLVRKFKSVGLATKIAHYIVAPIFYVLSGLALWFLVKAVPFIPYYLFYASKNSSFWELLIKYIFMGQELPWSNTILDYDNFQREVFISLQSGNMLIVALIFFFVLYKQYFKRKEHEFKSLRTIIERDISLSIYGNFMPTMIAVRSSLIHQKIKNALSTLLYGSLGGLLIIVFSMLFVMHTAYQLGSFGKNLAQFDMDYVIVDYLFNDQVKQVKGIRVYQDKNYIIIRDNLNILHSIVVEQIHIQTPQQKED